jgi:hypothetical protein
MSTSKRKSAVKAGKRRPSNISKDKATKSAFPNKIKKANRLLSKAVMLNNNKVKVTAG